MAKPSAEDLEEIAEGKASARDKAEAGTASERAAQRRLRSMRNHKQTRVRTKNATTKPSRRVKRKRH